MPQAVDLRNQPHASQAARCGDLLDVLLRQCLRVDHFGPARELVAIIEFHHQRVHVLLRKPFANKAQRQVHLVRLGRHHVQATHGQRGRGRVQPQSDSHGPDCAGGSDIDFHKLNVPAPTNPQCNARRWTGPACPAAGSFRATPDHVEVVPVGGIAVIGIDPPRACPLG